MFLLQNSLCSLSVNPSGFIEYFKLDSANIIHHAYIVLFKDYTRLDPFCRLLDTTSSIYDVLWDNDTISYTKQVEEFALVGNIKVLKNGWTWSISFQGRYPLGYRFGLACPCISPDISDFEQPINTEIAHFTRGLNPSFADQTLLSMPIVISGRQMCLFTSLAHDCQFFRYTDNETPYIRITKSTTSCNELSVTCLIESFEFMQQSYAQFHPEADLYINSWKPLVQNLERTKKIQISCIDTTTVIERQTLRIDVSACPTYLLKRFLTLMEQEISKYPADLLNRIGVDGIMIGGQIKVTKFTNAKLDLPFREVYCKGIGFDRDKDLASWIIYDANAVEPWLIHHEIYHFLDKHLDLKSWDSNMESIFTSPSNNTEEQRADVYAALMSCRALSGSAAEHNLQIMEKAVLNFCPELLDSPPVLPYQATIYAVNNGLAEPWMFGVPSNKPGAQFVASR